jgi:hypothetical protein
MVIAKNHVISLKAETADFIPPGIRVTDVINVSGEEKYLGFTLSNSTFDKEPVTFEESISATLKAFLLPQNPDAENQIIIRVNNIFLYEVLLEENSLVTTEMNLSFIKLSDTSFIELYRAAVSSNKTRNQKKNIIACLQIAFTGFANRSAANLLNTAKQPISQLMTNPLDQFSLVDFLDMDRAKAGIYRTFDDFFCNTPDTLTKFQVDYKDKTDKSDSLVIKHATPISIADGKEIKNAWGFTDGSTTFFKQNRRYYPLIEQENGLFLDYKVQSYSAVFPAALLGGFLGGTIGGVIAGAITGAVATSNGGYHGEQFVEFDLISGSLNIYLKSNEKEVSSTLVFYSPDKNEQTFDLFIDEKYRCSLSSNSWFEISFPSKKKTVKAMLKSSAGETFSDEINPELFSTNIYICYERNKKPPFFRKVSADATKNLLEDLTEETKVQ